MKRRSAGFTLIELLVVIGIIAVLAAALLPRVLEGELAGNIAADQANLRWHYQNLQEYKNRKFSLPKEGGHQFVLAPWVKDVCEHTEANLNRYFSPGSESDPRWDELKKTDPKEVWRTFDELSSEDTHYAGRAREHYRTMWKGDQALMATDNEFGNNFSDGTINVLMADGTVATLYKGEQLAEFWNDDDPEFSIEVGPESPVEMLQRLRR